MPSIGGKNRNCPNCAETIKSAAIMCRYCNRGISEDHYIRCRYCCEMVRKTAVRCRYCKYDTYQPPSLGGEPPNQEPPPDGSPVPRPTSGPLGSRAVALPLPEPEVFVDATPDLKRFKKQQKTEAEAELREDD